MLKNALTNWRTTAPGVALIGIGLFESLTGLHIPGFTMDAGPAIAAGIGLIMARDSSTKDHA